MEISHNLAFGADLNIGHLNSSTAPIGVTFDNCTLYNNSRGLQISAGGAGMGGIGPPVSGYVNVVRSHIAHSHLAALAIDGSTAESALVTIIDTVITDAPSMAYVTANETYPECGRWDQAWCKLDTRCRWSAVKDPVCIPGRAGGGNTTAISIYARATGKAERRTIGSTSAAHVILIRNTSVFVSGPRLNGLLDGRALLSADVVGDGQAVVQGSLTVHVPQQRLCQSAIATEGNLDTLAGLKVACVLKSDDDMKGSPDEIERLEPGTHVQATLPFLVIPRAF